MSFRDPDAYGALGDPNEEEQKKWPNGPQREPRTPKEPPRVDDPVPDGEGGEIFPRPYPVECPPHALPEVAPERRLGALRESVEGESRPSKQRTRRSGHAGGYLVMAASFLAAFVLMIGALALPSVPTVATPEEDEQSALPAEKVIYVNGYGDIEGAISTPELYQRCRASVVSISVKNGKTSGIGSGFVLDAEGYIATAYHVIAEMTEVAVILEDGTYCKAEMVGGDALTDLALLKIEAEGLSPVTLGSSADLLPGERVVAIGTPASLDYAGSISSGEVSYALRTVKFFGEGHTLEKKMKLIQTNAPVNPGNSGCPLFDGRGEVIGMVTMKLGNSFSGMGFAVPIDGAREVLDAMRRGEVLSDALLASVSVRAAQLGIVGEAFESDGTYGVRVNEIDEASGAAGVLCVGDLIVAIGDRTVTRVSDVEEVLLSYEPGDAVSISVLRNGQRLQFDVVLRARTAQ